MPSRAHPDFRARWPIIGCRCEPTGLRALSARWQCNSAWMSMPAKRIPSTKRRRPGWPRSCRIWRPTRARAWWLPVTANRPSFTPWSTRSTELLATWEKPSNTCRLSRLSRSTNLIRSANSSRRCAIKRSIYWLSWAAIPSTTRPGSWSSASFTNRSGYASISPNILTKRRLYRTGTYPPPITSNRGETRGPTTELSRFSSHWLHLSTRAAQPTRY